MHTQLRWYNCSWASISDCFLFRAHNLKTRDRMLGYLVQRQDSALRACAVGPRPPCGSPGRWQLAVGQHISIQNDRSARRASSVETVVPPDPVHAHHDLMYISEDDEGTLTPQPSSENSRCS